MRKYTESETREAIKDVVDRCELNGSYHELYNEGLINWRGRSKRDTERHYTEIIAEELMQAGVVDKLTLADRGRRSIPPITRIESYNAGHSPLECTGDRTNREEEWFAKGLYGYCNSDSPQCIEELGWIFDYQVPLKARRNDKAGKIDLVSYEQSGDAVYLLELKHKDNPETLLRCVLEISTYYELLHHENFRRSYESLGIPKEAPIKKAILLVRGSNPHKEALEMDQRPQLKRLIEDLKVSIFVITEGPPYSVDTLMTVRTDK